MPSQERKVPDGYEWLCEAKAPTSMKVAYVLGSSAGEPCKKHDP